MSASGFTSENSGKATPQGPPTLSFRELVTLAAVDPPPAALDEKLQQLLTQPFISNEASAANVQPKRPIERALGPVLRVAEWNINRGQNQHEIELALSGSRQFLAAAERNAKLKQDLFRRVADQVETLQQADVIILDEVDDGVKRTNYRNVTRDLAQKLQMNYVYGVEFIELDRIYLGLKKMDTVDLPRQRATGERFGVDPHRFLGLEGSAVLSRYPIRSARIVRLPVLYDWYHQEIQAVSDLERVRRWSAQKIFDEQIVRQVRRGGRMALLIDLAVPQAPGGTLTLVCPHLENYTGPRGRREQMAYLLKEIKPVANPVVVAGDLNTTGRNGRPLTVGGVLKKYLLNYRFWARQAFFFFVPVPGLGYVFQAANYMKNYHDPTAFNVPILLANRSKPLFKDIRQFRFADGSRFDFDSRKRASFHHRGKTLADSNQRAWKGFSPTFSFSRTYFHLVGEYKLDWIFVRSGISTPEAGLQGTAFRPHLGRTLDELNTALGFRISDHSPIVVDLPIGNAGLQSGVPTETNVLR